MRLRFPLLFAVLIGVLFASLCAHAQTTTRPNPPAAPAVALSGTVFDPSGRAVPGARVSLLVALTALDERQTDARGQFRFEGLRSGVFQLVASKPGFSTSSTEVELRDGEARSVDLRLKLSAVEQQVVVSASLGGVLAPQIGSSVSVVTQHEMDDRGAQGVLEVLRGVPGL